MMVTTSKLVLVAIVAAESASADVGSRQSKFDTLSGECTKVMLMDVLTDPAVCSDQVIAIRSGNGTLGYAFTIDSQGSPKPWIISFSGANLRHESQNGGTSTFSVYRIYLTINGETNDLIGLGSCVKGKLCRRVRHSPYYQQYVAELTSFLSLFYADCLGRPLASRSCSRWGEQMAIGQMSTDPHPADVQRFLTTWCQPHNTTRAPIMDAMMPAP
jgi:hypothetical protein